MRQSKTEHDDRRPQLGVQPVKITPRRRPYEVVGRGAMAVRVDDPEIGQLFRGNPPEHCDVHGFDYYPIFTVDGKGVCPTCASEAVLDRTVEPLPEGANLTGLSRRIAWLVRNADLTNDEADTYRRVGGACDAVYAAETQQAWRRLSEAIEAERSELSERFSIPLLVLPAELAAVLRCSVRTIERRAASHQIPGAIRVFPRNLAFRADVIDNWLRRAIGTEDPIVRFRRQEREAAELAEVRARGDRREAAVASPHAYGSVVVLAV